jgi:mannosidase alpha-like ER degradation enhancer 2
MTLGWLHFRACCDIWQHDIIAVNTHLPDKISGGPWYGHADMNTGKRTATEYGALDAFFPAELEFSSNLKRAGRMQASSYKMWDLYGIELEVLDYRAMKVESPGYELQPEIVEPTYYLYHLTYDPAYQGSGREMFDTFVMYCRAPNDYAALKSVITGQQRGDMESLVLSGTFRYFYLLFALPQTLGLDKVVFNTETHPLRGMLPVSIVE